MTDDTIKKHWIIVREPNCVPEKKHPIPNSHEGTLKMLRELIACRPDRTELTIARLTWDDDLWVEDGREAVLIDDHFTPRRRKYRIRRAAHSHKPNTETSTTRAVCEEERQYNGGYLIEEEGHVGTLD